MSTKKETKLRAARDIDFEDLRAKIASMQGMAATCVSSLRDEIIPLGQRAENTKKVLFKIEQEAWQALHMIRE